MPRHSSPPDDASPRAARPSNRGPDIAATVSSVSSFPAQVGEGCRALVLGTMPGVRSLAEQQFYAHPRNLFWPFMGDFFGAGPDLPYAARLARLHACGIGLWDVLQTCERTGSLDAAIRIGSEVPNDIAGLLVRHPTIAAIALNGSKAAAVFSRRIVPLVDPARFAELMVLPMPSTSPANASLAQAMKKERWAHLCRWIDRTRPP